MYYFLAFIIPSYSFRQASASLDMGSRTSILKIVIIGIMKRWDGAVSDRMDIRVKVRPDLAIQNQTFSCKKEDDKGDEYVFCRAFHGCQKTKLS